MLPAFIPFTLIALTLAVYPSDGWRDRFLRALVLFGAAILVSTELLGAFQQLCRAPLAIFWAAIPIACVAVVARRRPVVRFGMPRFVADPVIVISLAGIVAILTLTAVTAAFSPPNSADAMAYHLPRVVYWAEAGSVRFFPTAYFNQVMLQPFAEYLMLHLYVLAGGDYFINFVQWFASFAAMTSVSAVAKELGMGARGQAFAALFCATLPAGILASSGAKNDYFMAMWLVAALYFALRFTSLQGYRDALLTGGALGFALFTKATAYVFAPFLLAAIFLAPPCRQRRRLLAGALLTVAIAAAINTPQYFRNFELSGSIMGFDSAQGDGVYRWRNDSFGWKQTASNMLRNLSDQLGARDERWNRAVYNAVVSAHRRLRIAPDDPATTFRDSVYGPPLNANHEANAPNRWHLFLLCGVGCVLLFRARFRRVDLARALYAAALICAFVAFSAYLKWQAFFGRLLLPLFIAGAPVAAMVTEFFRSSLVPAALCLFLLNNARHPLLENWVRPLTGPGSVLRAPRDRQYFADMTQWHNQASYLKAVDLLANSPCGTVGIDIADMQLEYPVQALLRERRPAVRFVHTGVQNVSARYPQPIAARPCAVVCLDCAGDTRRLAFYHEFQRSARIDQFVLFFRE